MGQPGGALMPPAAVTHEAPYAAALVVPAEGPQQQQQQQQQLPPQVFHMPLQQGALPDPLGTHAAVHPEPTGHPAAAAAAEPPAMVPGHPTTLLVAGAQWLHTPAHYPAPRWPAPVAAGYAVQRQPVASVLSDSCCCAAVA
uniref:Uncharacterized protein n=1 Tax=Tetradesmus obliquus TaxID=3088 RepID=A0A383WL65_TETOB|eukprot:jgi/Sobl393_1/10829/SZX77962.1